MKSRVLAVLAICMACLSSVVRAGVEDDFLRAREAHYAGKAAAFEKYAARIPADHVLYPYIAYWRLGGEGATAGDARIADFLAAYPGTWLAERVRGDWLKRLGQREMWPAYLAEFPRLANPDVAHECYARRAELAAGNTGRLKDAVAMWFTGRDMPAACNGLFAQLISAGWINREDVWRRLRLALEAGNPGVAKTVATALPEDERISGAHLDQAARDPSRLLESATLQPQRRADREVALYALAQLARADLAKAEAALRAWLPNLADADRRYAWGLLATQAAKRHEARALAWFDLAGPLAVNDAQREWWARIALRHGQWKRVASAIDTMSEANRALPAWRYWRGRAYLALGQPLAARQWLAPLSRETHFYGLLALEELGPVAGTAPQSVKVRADEIEAMAGNPGIRRALALYRMGLRGDAEAEWKWAIRDATDRELLAAAELARRADWYDRAINTAEKTREEHDFELRFLAPYREWASRAAAENHLDEAWVYGLIRQESRFMQGARSTVGAQGLMQIMPETARWIARHLGLGRLVKAVHEPQTNIRFGTYYLRHVLESLDNSPVLATAAYNAGPRRAQRWRDTRSLEAAVYIESIPFAETRDYVKKVMSNAIYYAARFGQPSVLLKDRLGVIPPRKAASEPAAGDEDGAPTLEPEAGGV
jgi:soluble lytic murein transglycosylase